MSVDLGPPQADPNSIHHYELDVHRFYLLSIRRTFPRGMTAVSSPVLQFVQGQALVFSGR